MPPKPVLIVNVQRFSTEDGPGIRTTVFFKGCPMQCPWCQNPETLRFEPEVVWHAGRCLGDEGCLDVCTAGALRASEQGIRIDRERCTGCGECAGFCPAEALETHGRSVSVPGLFDEVSRDAAFYEASGGGVTLSGGEPLAQPEGAIALLRLLRNAGIHTALDTCGAAGEAALREALEWVDLVLFDVKTVDRAKHLAFTGVAFDRVALAAHMVDGSETPVWVRTPIIPGYTDDERNVRAVARFVKNTFSHCERHDLLAFSNLCRPKYEQLERDVALADTPLVTADHMEHLCNVAREEGAPNVHWSGPTRLDVAASEVEGGETPRGH